MSWLSAPPRSTARGCRGTSGRQLCPDGRRTPPVLDLDLDRGPPDRRPSRPTLDRPSRAGDSPKPVPNGLLERPWPRRRRNLIPGRTSLTAGSTHSPGVQFRVPEAVATQAQDRARARRRRSGRAWCRETRSLFRGCSGLGVGLGGWWGWRGRWALTTRTSDGVTGACRGFARRRADWARQGVGSLRKDGLAPASAPGSRHGARR